MLVFAIAIAGVVNPILIIFVAFYGGVIFFLIWTIIVAKNARNEIKEDQGQEQVQEMGVKN